jgi:hypothetical protein
MRKGSEDDEGNTGPWLKSSAVFAQQFGVSENMVYYWIQHALVHVSLTPDLHAGLYSTNG